MEETLRVREPDSMPPGLGGAQPLDRDPSTGRLYLIRAAANASAEGNILDLFCAYGLVPAATNLTGATAASVVMAVEVACAGSRPPSDLEASLRAVRGVLDVRVTDVGVSHRPDVRHNRP